MPPRPRFATASPRRSTSSPPAHRKKMTRPWSSRGRCRDRQPWDLEQRMFGGYAPVVFVINIFSGPRVLSFFDWSYARVFFASLAIAFTFFMSHPSRRVRAAFADGNAALWIAGAWLYLLFPTVGPACAFPELWMPIRESIPVTNLLHVRLMTNYKNVLLLGRGISAPLT